MNQINSTQVTLDLNLRFAILTVLFLFGLPNLMIHASSHGSLIGSTTSASPENDIQRLPIRFTENRGQIVDTDGNLCPDILYAADAAGVKIYVRSTGISYVFSHIPDPEQGAALDVSEVQVNGIESGHSREVYRVDLTFEGGNPFARVSPTKVLEGVMHFYLAHCPEGIRNVRSYEGLILKDIYPQIDMRLSTVGGRVKSEFMVRPGGDPNHIRMKYEGASRCRVLSKGEMHVDTPLGRLEESEPVSWIGGGKRIPTRYLVHGQTASFDVADYDRTETLIIDPWATYHGGTEYEHFNSVGCDAMGNVYAAGWTESADFPVQSGTQLSSGGNDDAIVVKYSNSGQLIWATYYGGSGDDGAGSVRIDVLGNVFLTGKTESSNFPVHNALQGSLSGAADTFLIKFSSSGVPSWATFFGGSGEDGNDGYRTGGGGGLSVDASGNAYICHTTQSTDLQVKHAQQSAPGGARDAFLAKFTGSGSLCWATYLGGSGNEGIQSCVVTPQHTVAVCGNTASPDFPLQHALQSTFQGNAIDAFITEYDTSGVLHWSSYIAGNAAETGMVVTSDQQGALYVGLRCSSSNMPLLNPVQSTLAGSVDIYLCKYGATANPANGRSLELATYWGGSEGDYVNKGCIDVTSGGDIIVSGETFSPDFPLLNPIQSSLKGDADICIVKLTSNGVVASSTYYGGSKVDGGLSEVIDPNGNLFVVGNTESTDFPVVNAHQATLGGSFDGFILHLSLSGSVVLPPAAPTNLTAQALSPTTVQLDWTDNSDNEDQFEIEHKTGSTTWTNIENASADSHTRILSNLGYDTEHMFRVRAVNAQYESAYTNTASVTTPNFNAPSDLAGDSLAFSYVVLSWRDNSSSEDRFVVEKSEGGSSWIPVDTTMKNMTVTRISGLSPQTESSFRVKAVEGTVSSPYSNTIALTTLPFSPPSDLTATPHSSEEINLIWRDKTNGENGFIIQLRKVGESWSIVDTASENTTEHIIGGLQPSTSYEFRIHAFTSRVESPYSNIAQATTLKFLGAPTNLSGVLMSETNIVLNWEDNTHGETGYEIEHREDDGDWQRIHTAAANATVYDVQGLTPQTMNRFRVRAIGDGSASGYSNVIAIETRMMPSKPLNLQAMAVDHRSIRITWQRGSENEDRFEVERREIGGDWAQLTTAGPGDGDILDENLSITTTYWYRVRAGNDQGYSQWSNVDSATTMDIPVPDGPFGLQAKATGPASIQLSWIMPSPSTAESFEIELSVTGDPGSFSRVSPDAEADARTIVVDQLQPDTEYFFRIRAVNRSGPSPYSNTASARTSRADYPSTPRNFTAAALSESQIQLDWEMPAQSNEDGFTLVRSLTGDTGDFTELSPAPGQGDRSYIDSGLTVNTTYYYRILAYNMHGSSSWTPVVNATTQKVIVTPELRAAMDGKRQVISQVKTLIPNGSTEMQTLRNLIGDYVRGYDESAATDLITEWSTTGASDPAKAAEAMERYLLVEEALRESWGDDESMPPIPGVQDLAMQCGRIPAIATKDLTALALAWKSERAYLTGDNEHVDAAMEDMVLALSDNTRQLLMLMGADRGSELSTLTDDIIRGRGEVEDLDAGLMLSLLDYWKELMLGRYYLPATQPLIAEYADRTEQLDYDGTKAVAEGTRDAYLTNLRMDIDALGAAFSDYYRISTSLDAAYTIGQTPGVDADIFLLRVKGLRPRLTDNMYMALANAVIPTERFLYLTSLDAVKDLGSVPSALDVTAEKIFDPQLGGIVQRKDPLSVFRKAAVPADNPVIDADFARLQSLRTEVEQGNTGYISDAFTELRTSGKAMVSEVDRLLRPLLGVNRVHLYGDEVLLSDYYYSLARMQLLKTRRTVLSVALADYMLAPTTQKQTALVAEIDSIIGPFSNAQNVIEDMISGARSIISLPALSLTNAGIIRDEAAGPERHRIHFTVQNVGGGEASDARTTLDFLSSGVTIVGENEFSLGSLQPSASMRDSMDVDIAGSVTHVTFSAVLETGGRSFIDRRTIAVPLRDTTTTVRASGQLPASCILHKNYPNPFNPITTIRFTLPRETEVSLVITDALGREVNRAVGREQLAVGTHSVRFDASGLPSGVYFYRLETPDVVLVRKMVLMR